MCDMSEWLVVWFAYVQRSDFISISPRLPLSLIPSLSLMLDGIAECQLGPPPQGHRTTALDGCK